MRQLMLHTCDANDQGRQLAIVTSQTLEIDGTQL